MFSDEVNNANDTGKIDRYRGKVYIYIDNIYSIQIG